MEKQALGTLLPLGFYETRPELVAPRLLGKVLAHRSALGWLSGRIVEVEAYLGPHNKPPDPAAHAHRGPTPRNMVLFGLAGHAYVYSIYGMYFCLNVSCEAEGLAGCVLIRALEPLTGIDQMALNRRTRAETGRDFSEHPPGKRRASVPEGQSGLGPSLLRQLTSGPSRLCQALGILRTSHNGLNVTSPQSPLQILDDGFPLTHARVTGRIGIKEAVDWPLRFSMPDHFCVSGPKNLPGSVVLIP